jgi:hypothetical protein
MSSDILETADNLNHEVADRETEADEIGHAAQSTSNNRQRRATEISRIEAENKSKDFAIEG